MQAALGAVRGDGARGLVPVHVGQSIVLLRRSDGPLLPVTSRAHGLVPGGLCLPHDDDFGTFAALARRGGAADLHAWDAIRPAAGVDLSVRPGVADAAATTALRAAALRSPDPAPPMSPHPVRRRAAALVRSAAAGDAAQVRRLLTHVVGVGPGSTPSGDDVVVGLLAGLDLAGHRAGAGADLVRSALPGLLDRTTTPSRHDLAAAIDGQFATRVHVLLDAVHDPGRVPAAVRAARTWGATSGLDLAAGVAAGARLATTAPHLRQPPTLRRSA